MRHRAAGPSGDQPGVSTSSRADHPSRARTPAAPSGPPLSDLADPAGDGARSELLRGLMEYRWDHLAGPYAAADQITPLLDLWALASPVDSAAARPIEHLLTSLVRRTLVTSDELARGLEEVRAAVADLPG